MSTVLITIPGGLSSDGLQIAVKVFGVEIEGEGYHDAGLDEVLIRPAYSSQAWERLAAVGGTVEVRS